MNTSAALRASFKAKELITLLGEELNRLEEANACLRTQLKEAELNGASRAAICSAPLERTSPRATSWPGSRLEPDASSLLPSVTSVCLGLPGVLAPERTRFPTDTNPVMGKVMPDGSAGRSLNTCTSFDPVVTKQLQRTGTSQSNPPIFESEAWATKIGHRLSTAGSAFQQREQDKESIVKRASSSKQRLYVFSSCSLLDHGTIPARLLRSRFFEVLSFFAIALNTIWLPVDVDLNDAVVVTEAAWYFQVIEHGFCTFFFLEWLLWLFAAKSKRQLMVSGWFLFDTLIVGNILLDTWVFPLLVSSFGGSSALGLDASVFRLLRLSRLSRIFWVARVVPEVVFILKGLAQATRTVSCTMVLLLSVVYSFGIVLKQLSLGTLMGEEYFATVPRAMYTCLMAGTLLDDVREVMDAVKAESVLCAMAFALVIIFSALTMMNMLVGVMCDVIGNVTSKEKEEMQVASVKRELHELLEGMNRDDGYISKEEFADLLLSPRATTALAGLGVDVLSLVDAADLLFQSDEHGQQFDKRLDFDVFMDAVLQLRGANTATVRDITNLRNYIHMQNTKRNLGFLQMEENQKELANNQQKIHTTIVHELKAISSSLRASGILQQVSGETERAAKQPAKDSKGDRA